MRALFTCRHLAGHLHPLLPLAEAAVAHGHDVAFATADPALSDARRRGFTAFEAGPGEEAREDFVRTHPGPKTRLLFFKELFLARELPARLPALHAIVAAFRPDVIVHEIAEPAAPMAAAAAGIPYATTGFGPVPPSEIVQLLGPIRRYLDPCPPALQRDTIRDLPAAQVRLTPRPVPGPPPVELGPHERTVYVTFGTVWNRDATVFRAVFEALADRPVNVIATLGSDLELGPTPPNVRVHRYIPQAQLLPHCDAAIIHGGAGTMLGALAHGLPLLLLPQGADQHDNAERAVLAGAGLTGLDVDRLLDDAGLRSAARRIAEELRAMPGPDAGVAHLVALCT
jgi:UDP:flavonoid glycosyltransferase YjiC (YdhE family)